MFLSKKTLAALLSEWLSVLRGDVPGRLALKLLGALLLWLIGAWVVRRLVNGLARTLSQTRVDLISARLFA